MGVAGALEAGVKSCIAATRLRKNNIMLSYYQYDITILYNLITIQVIYYINTTVVGGMFSISSDPDHFTCLIPGLSGL
jgi:hypothetical protein